MEALRPRIQEITDALIGDISSRGKANLIGEVAFPLATTVICELLGVPADDRTTFGDWFTAALTRPTPPMRTPSSVAPSKRARNSYSCGEPPLS